MPPISLAARWLCIVAVAVHGALAPLSAFAQESPTPSKVDHRPFGIHVVDDVTGRGVPLIELRTVNDVPFITDSGGWIAFDEPGLLGREVYFSISGPGYEAKADGFGMRGVRLTPQPGAQAEVKVHRINVAERLYRLTGGGIYRDSELLGVPKPEGASNLNAGVLGQDSVQSVPYRGQTFWLWGDTSLPNYPLGNFHTTSALGPGPGEIDPEKTIVFNYFMDRENPGRVRKMAPSREPGPVWIFGLINLPDENGRESLLAHYSRQVNLEKVAEHGLVKFNDERGEFDFIKKLDLSERWRHPNSNAFHVKQLEGEYIYFASPFPTVRVKADWASATNPDAYEALTYNIESKQYEWNTSGPPISPHDELKLIDAKKLSRADARQIIDDAATGERVLMHGTSIGWNEHRKRWVLIGLQAGERGAPSYIGEVWYAESDSPTGPWSRGVKIASHPNYSFYNVRRHDFLDRENGRVIYFEGTYTKTFSGAPVAVPRYEYNQLLYRLDLDDDRLKAAR